MKKLLWFLIPLGLLVAGVAIAVNVTVPQSPAAGSVLFGNANGTYNSSTTPISIGTSTQATTFSITSSTGTSLLTVLANGNVGIGTSTPGKTLDVVGTGKFSGKVSIGSLATAPNNANSGLTMQGDYSNGIVTTYNSTGALGLAMDLSGTYPTLHSDFTTGSDPTLHLSAYTDRNNSNALFIQTGGNVGVGVAVPTATLHVQGSGTTNPFVIASSTGTSMLTMTPLGNLQLNGTAQASFDTNVLYLGSTAETGGYMFGSSPSFQASNGPYFGARGITYSAISNQRGNFFLSAGNPTTPGALEGQVRMNTGNDLTRLVLGNSGQVGLGGSITNLSTLAGASLVADTMGQIGIGSTTPAAMLGVEGISGSTTPVFIVASSTNAQYLTVTSGGNVNITNSNLTGSSASSNFFNITGAMPTTMTADTWGTFINVSGSGTSNFVQTPFRVDYTGGYSGAGTSIAGTFVNRNTGSGTTLSFSTGTTPKGNLGLNGAVIGSTTGYNIGGVYFAENGSLNIGFQGNATVNKNSGTNIGVTGFGLNGGTSPIEIGGYFGLQNSTPTFVSAALLADNGTEAQPIFIARDNGTAVVTIADGGQIQSASGSVSAPTYSFTSGVTSGMYLSNTNTVGIAAGGNLAANMTTTSIVFGTWQAAANSVFNLDVVTGGVGNSNRDGNSMGLRGGQSTGNGAGGAIIFSTTPAGSSGTQANPYAEAMRITSAGNVGIGTSTPQSTLTVVGTFQLPFAAASSISTVGQAAINTTAGTFSFNDGTAQRYLNPEHLITPFYIENPSSNEDDHLWIANATTTITKILCVNKGPSDSANFNLVWDNSNQTATSSATSRVFTAFTACAATTTPVSINLTGSTTVNTLQPLRFITSTASSSGLTLTIYGRDNQ